MRRLVEVVLVVCSLVALFLPNNSNRQNEYYRSAEVIKIENDMVWLEDTIKNVWTVEDDSLKLYGRYTLVMDSQGTELVSDDTIKEIK